ncbi:hypothetical protein CHARACLAT_025565 [Characodon lateralis]|uniref:Uncharacterized protein n=1 Tax=Characodon lateralis TaxID=208331 RepID=A0ABU7CR72_9TELE|nr:hypothetical protein [Characodon lateralis]
MTYNLHERSYCLICWEGPPSAGTGEGRGPTTQDPQPIPRRPTGKERDLGTETKVEAGPHGRKESQGYLILPRPPAN